MVRDRWAGGTVNRYIYLTEQRLARRNTKSFTSVATLIFSRFLPLTSATLAMILAPNQKEDGWMDGSKTVTPF